VSSIRAFLSAPAPGHMCDSRVFGFTKISS
jgi:hypothetical protein